MKRWAIAARAADVTANSNLEGGTRMRMIERRIKTVVGLRDAKEEVGAEDKARERNRAAKKT